MTDQQFETLLRVLGDVGTAAYQSALRQATLDGWISTIMLGASGVFGFLFLIYTARVFMGSDPIDWESTDGPTRRATLAAILGILGVFMSLIALSFFPDALKELLNPQWYAIQSLARLVR